MQIFKQWRARRHASGQTIVLFALMSVVLIAGLGLVIDSGVNYAERRNTQNAADTAAIAGARVIARQASPSLSVSRADVWSAVFNTAVANGAPNDASLYSCDFIDNANPPNAMNQPCTAVGLIPTGATGVRLRVSETHTTLFMRVLGIKTSGTAASSSAQVQVIPQMLEADVVFMVCGTSSPNGVGSSILFSEQVDDPGWSPPPSPTPAPPTPKMTRVVEPARINPAMYAYDWNVRKSDGTLSETVGAPSYTISADTMSDDAKCGLSGNYNYDWHGLIKRTDNTDPDVQVINIPTNGDPNGAIPFITAAPGTLPANTGPRHTINGTQGCVTGATPNGCVMILPIVVPNEPSAYRDNNGNDKANHVLDGRLWAAFMVTKSGTTYTGKLIKNYPVHTNGKSLWSLTYPNALTPYSGPIAINLVK